MDGINLDDLQAPQWAALGSSPQVADDFFDREHKDLEPRSLQVEIPPPPKPASSQGATFLDVPEIVFDFAKDVDTVNISPVQKVISHGSRNKEQVMKETTMESVLSEAMTNLKLSVKKNPRRSGSVAQTPGKTTDKFERLKASRSMNFNMTPSNPIPMRIKRSQMYQNAAKATPAQPKSPKIGGTPCSTKIDKTPMAKAEKTVELKAEKTAELKAEKTAELKPEKTTELTPESSIKKEPKPHSVAASSSDIRESRKNVELPQSSQGRMEIDSEIPTAGPSKEVAITDEAFEDTEKVYSKIKMSFGKQSTDISGKLDKKNSAQPRYSTSTYHRRSLTKYRRRSNKFISMAEAINKFQNGTPKRFRSISNKELKPGPLAKVRQSCLRVTRPISPALRSKTRVRPNTAMSQEEREELEWEEIRQHRIKANPVKASTLKGPAPLKNVPKIPITVPEPFKLTAIKKSHHGSSHSLPDVKVTRESRPKITVPVVMNDNAASVKDVEVLNDGIPQVDKARFTKVNPFSFEFRNKEMLKKKEQKLKQLMTEEEKKIKVSFHARPVPAFKKPMLPAATEQLVVQKPAKTKPCPFSFDERDKRIVKKKEELIKHVMEEDKKAREFHARPVPEFKPVLVRGKSKENVNINDKAPPASQKGRSMLPVARSNSKTNLVMVKKESSERENRNPDIISEPAVQSLPKSNAEVPKKELKQRPKTVLAEFNLNSDKRAKARREFDERIRQKELEIEMERKKAAEERLQREEAERAEIRRLALIKARPMPSYKPLNILSSDKPLTDPQSPAWAARSKT